MDTLEEQDIAARGQGAALALSDAIGNAEVAGCMESVSEGTAEAADYDSCLGSFPDDDPNWDWEHERLNLRNSRPLDVYRHSDYPAWKAVLTDIIDDVLGQKVRTAGSHINKGLEPSFPSSGIPVGLPASAGAIVPSVNRSNRASSDRESLRKHLRIVLLDASVSLYQDSSQWIGYSRSHDDKVERKQKSRYNKLHLSVGMLGKAIDLLVDHGYFEGWVPEPGKRGMQSRFRALPKLATLVNLIPVEQIDRDWSKVEPIILRGEKDKKTHRAPFIEYDDDDYQRKNQPCLPAVWRNNLAKINAQIASSELGIDVDLLTRHRLKIDYSHNQLYRVFNNGDWNQGGRFFGCWHQGIESEYRRHLTIDRQPTVEIDYSQIHPMMLYLSAGTTTDREGIKVALSGPGLTVPEDSYTIAGHRRGTVKTVFNAMLNVSGGDDIEGAIKKAVGFAGYEDAKAEARKRLGDNGKSAIFEEVKRTAPAKIAEYQACIQPIREKHKSIADAFGTGIGLLLQNRDAQMAEYVMLELASRGITVLPVHDSFIVAAEHEGLLLDAMNSALHEFLPEVAVLTSGVNFKVTYADGKEAKLRTIAVSGTLAEFYNHESPTVEIIGAEQRAAWAEARYKQWEMRDGSDSR